MIRFKQRGSFNNFERWTKRTRNQNLRAILARYGERGVSILSSATPVDTRETANSWSFNVSQTSRGYSLSWSNDSMNEGVPIVILLVYGHATRGGSFVNGDNFINPVMKPLFDKLSDDLWKEVTQL